MAFTQRRRRSRNDGGSWLDRAIYAIAPTWGAKRMATRRMYEVAEGQSQRFARIEAAENSETRSSRWLISRLSPDSQLEQDLQTTRDRSRDIYQNDAMGGAIEGKINHVIGTGHKPQARVRSFEGESGSLSDESAAAFNRQIEHVYEQWNGHADRSGRRSLWMLSRLAERHNEFDGESFTVLSDVGRAGKPIPLAIQVIDPERVDTPPEFMGDENVRLGIRYVNGEIDGYYVQKSHPGDTKNTDISYDYVESDRMLHVFEPWFAEQSRGLPWMTRALNRARDAKDFDEAAILGAQIEQCFAGFVKPAMTSSDLSRQAATSATDASGRHLQDIVPGSLQHLNPGDEIEFGSPSRPGSNFSPFMEWNYRRVAAAINWPYEMVVKNWTGLSFAAGRLVLTDAKKATEVGQKIMREMWFTRIWERMVEEAAIVGEVDIDLALFNRNLNAFCRHTWIAPKWEYALNPNEEVKADVLEVEENLSTLEDKLSKRGYDLEEFIERKRREKQLISDARLAPEVAHQRGADAIPQPNSDDAEVEEQGAIA